ncbi:MAG: chemotaxis protein CheA [Isosphaeraceae bacterium]
MSGFNLSELMPFYLDETDEHIAGLNDSLLRLEQDPTDAKALQEAFRMFHSIKGASVVMGFTPVNRLTHHMESLFEQLRSKKRTLDRPVLDLTFRCLDELRDYHRDLRAQGQSEVDLSGLTALVEAALHAPAPAAKAVAASPATPAPAPRPAEVERFDEPSAISLTVVFEADLPLADMKARLVLNRVSSRARVLGTDPPMERLDEVDPLSRFTLFLVTDCETDELRALADVEGVAQVRIKAAPEAGIAGSASISPPAAQPAPLPPSVPARPDPVPEPSAPIDRPSRPVEVEPAAATIVVPSPATMEVPDAENGIGAAAAAAMTETATPAGPKAGGPKKARIAETIRVESDRLDHLMNLAGELVITKARFVAISRGLDELFRGSNAHALASDTRERLDSVTRGLEGLAQVKAGSGPSPSASGGSPDRWSGHVRRLRENFRAIQDELELIREAREQLKALSEAIHSLGRVSDGLQKGVLDTRMVPIGPLFERFRRVIRDLSHSSGKEVLLQIGGEKTELDKRMIDELSDPLIHMVRNAVDHGLEPPDRREAAGKPRAGTVSLLASHRGNSVVITVSDDGRGIDCERIRHKIVAKGLVGKAEAAELSDRELVNYIWHPGLSTAETITEISGRGVGMDIVKSRIENLNGAVDVRSVLGQGTTFIIRLPLTLAIMSSLLVRIYDEIYAIPLDHIDEIVEIRPDRIYRVQGRPAIEIRKKIVALVWLGDVFQWGDQAHPSTRDGSRPDGESQVTADDASDKRTVVVVQNGETTIGLVVDQLIGMQEVVLKSLEKNFQSIPGLSGASILGDGRVSLILDLDAVIDMVARLPARRRE